MIRPEHVLASASIPILFPAVPIGGVYHCDGGLHQNTPLSPALRLGADRVLVIGIRRSEEGRRPEPGEPYPTPVFLAGKIMDSMLLDRIDYDIDRLNLVNDMLEAGERAFGAEFKAAIDQAVARRRGTPYRKVKCLYIRPSRDIGEIALTCIKSGDVDARGFTRRLIRRVASAESDYGADLMSYLLFDRSFANRLIALGFEDARRQRDEILDFFDDQDLGGPALAPETAVEDFRFDEEQQKEPPPVVTPEPAPPAEPVLRKRA
jgi:NTE family protein